MIEMLFKRTRTRFEDESKTALDYVVEWIENGHTLTQLQLSLEKEMNGGDENGPIVLGRSMLSKYLDSLGPATELFAEARKSGAHSMVERANVNLDDKRNDSDRDRLNANDKRLQAKERLAAVWSSDFRNSKNAGVSITIGSLHLEALRVVNAQRPSLPATATIMLPPSEEEPK